VTNNNGFGIGWLDLVTPSFTVSLNHTQLQQLTISDCLRHAPFWLDYECLPFHSVWLGSDLRNTNEWLGSWFSFLLRLLWTMTDLRLNHEWPPRCELRMNAFLFERPHVESSGICCLRLSMDTFVASAATIWLPSVYSFHIVRLKICMTGDLVEHTRLFFRKVGYARCDALSQMLQTNRAVGLEAVPCHQTLAYI
jgi:hypothetical protein